VTDLDVLAAFVLARIAEEEADARAATPAPWWVENTTSRRWTVMAAADDAPELAQMVGGGNSVRRCGDADTRHIARQNPAVTLARGQALRSLVELHGRVEEHGEAMCGHCARPGEISGDLEGDWPCATLRLVASIYRYRPDGSQHPDWQADWAV
jgi:hypothetical protein